MLRENAWLMALMAVSTGMLLWAFHARYDRFRPGIVRAEAAQWALTTAWMMDNYYARHGHYRACGGHEQPCWRLLGWMDHPEHLDRYDLRVQLTADSYQVIACVPEGHWVVEPGRPIRWEGEEVLVPWPRRQLVEDYQKLFARQKKPVDGAEPER